ncbi:MULTISPECIES: hypothetical protein [unclassified Streptomyces]|uniref:hypothetical protein n=1 Tax=unclassified Streptomyces TaxID=2593676 RepID=UPI00131AEDD6|nr:hypothetical protein [Streptomyces sp. CB01635]
MEGLPRGRVSQLVAFAEEAWQIAYYPVYRTEGPRSRMLRSFAEPTVRTAGDAPDLGLGHPLLLCVRAS